MITKRECFRSSDSCWSRGLIACKSPSQRPRMPDGQPSCSQPKTPSPPIYLFLPITCRGIFHTVKTPFTTGFIFYCYITNYHKQWLKTAWTLAHSSVDRSPAQHGWILCLSVPQGRNKDVGQAELWSEVLGKKSAPRLIIAVSGIRPSAAVGLSALLSFVGSQPAATLSSQRPFSDPSPAVPRGSSQHGACLPSDFSRLPLRHPAQETSWKELMQIG